MDKKPQKSWTDVQMTIAAIAITATLGMWNVFSVPQKQQVVQITDTTTPPPPPPPPAEVAVATATQLPQFIPVKIIFGGTAPQQKIVVQGSAAQSPAKNKGNGGGSGGGGGKPIPHGGTGSSKP